jgi:hypothetical protein
MPHFAIDTIISVTLAVVVILVALAILQCRPISDRELMLKLRKVNLKKARFKDLLDMIFNAWLLRRYTRNFPDADTELRKTLNDLRAESTRVITLAGKRAIRQRADCVVTAYRNMVATATYLNIEVAPDIVRQFEDRALRMM